LWPRRCLSPKWSHDRWSLTEYGRTYQHVAEHQNTVCSQPVTMNDETLRSLNRQHFQDRAQASHDHHILVIETSSRALILLPMALRASYTFYVSDDLYSPTCGRQKNMPKTSTDIYIYIYNKKEKTKKKNSEQILDTDGGGTLPSNIQMYQTARVCLNATSKNEFLIFAVNFSRLFKWWRRAQLPQTTPLVPPLNKSENVSSVFH